VSCNEAVRFYGISAEGEAIGKRWLGGFLGEGALCREKSKGEEQKAAEA